MHDDTSHESAGRMREVRRAKSVNAMKSNKIANTCTCRSRLFSKLKSVLVVTTLPLIPVLLLLVGVGQVQVQAFGTTTTTAKTTTTITTTATRRRGSAAVHHYCSVSPPSTASTSRLFETRSGSSDNTNTCSMSDVHGSSQPATTASTRSTGDSLQFGRFTISPQQIFYASPTALSAAIVNLRPIVPGHVLVISTRVVPHLSDLTQEEYVDLWTTVRKVQHMLGQKYFAAAATGAAFNVAVQDGRSAGQSVPHVHVHILPRSDGDFERNDDVYDELEAWAPTAKDAEAKKQQQHNAKLEVLEDADRKDRTMEQMGEEAEEYRKLMGAMQ